jgi:hypothetical protein
MTGDRWHTEEEVFLENLQKQCETLYKYTIKEHHYYDRLSGKFNVPILIISSINSLTAVGLNSFIEQKYVSVLNAVLSAGTGVLGSIQLYLKLNEKMTKATRASIGFKRISLKISRELALAREVRTTEGPAFVQDCFSEYNQVLESSNPIEKKLEEFLAIKKPGDVSMPTSPSHTTMNESLRTVADKLMNLARVRVNINRGGDSPGDDSPV